MIPQDLAKKIRYIEIVTRQAVNDFLAGEYHSIFKGQGIEFEEVRPYQAGDDVRSIDWNVTARMGHPFVKRFVEERELTVMLLVDLSASGSFGSVHQLKNELAAELCGLLAFSAIKNNDQVGLILFTDGVEKAVAPAKGRSHVLRLIRELLRFKARQSRTNIPAGIDYLSRVTKKRCVVFLVSDFQDDGFERPLRALGRRHDLIAVSITDPRELRLPRVGLLELEDAETGRFVQLDSGSARVRRKYEQLVAARRSRLEGLFRSSNIDRVEIRTDHDYVRELVKFFRARERRAHI